MRTKINYWKSPLSSMMGATFLLLMLISATIYTGCKEE